MSNDLEFPNYATTYSKEAKKLRDALPTSLRPVLDKIENGLAENPDEHPRLTLTLSPSENIFVYKHPKPHIEVTYKINREKKIIYFLHLAAPTLEVSKPLFISYSHKDEKWLLRLKDWLKTLEQQDSIQIWDDREIKSGEDWQEKIKAALASSKAAILLISQNFLASDFIANHELPKLLDSAKNEGLTIFWIPVSESTVDDTEISKYEPVVKKPLDSFSEADLNKQFRIIYKRIKEVVEK